MAVTGALIADGLDAAPTEGILAGLFSASPASFGAAYENTTVVGGNFVGNGVSTSISNDKL